MWLVCLLDTNTSAFPVRRPAPGLGVGTEKWSQKRRERSQTVWSWGATLAALPDISVPRLGRSEESRHGMLRTRQLDYVDAMSDICYVQQLLAVRTMHARITQSHMTKQTNVRSILPCTHVYLSWKGQLHHSCQEFCQHEVLSPLLGSTGSIGSSGSSGSIASWNHSVESC